jgi:hypothetical protein
VDELKANAIEFTTKIREHRSGLITALSLPARLLRGVLLRAK